MRLNFLIGTTLMAASLTATGAFAQAAAPRARAAATVSNETPYLGIGVQDVDSERATALKLKEVRGAEITSVTENGPASKAGIKDGDVVLEYNGQPVEGKDQLARLVRETPIGRQVKIGVWRNGAMQTVTATMEAKKGGNVMVFGGDGAPFPMPDGHIPDFQSFKMPDIEIPRFQMLYPSPLLGIQGESLGNQEQLAEFFGVKEGVLVKSVNRNSAAEKAGIKAGDVIVRVEDTKVNNTQELTSALRSHRSNKNVNLTVVRNKKEMPVTVTIETATAAGAVRAELRDAIRDSIRESVRGIRPMVVVQPGPIVIQIRTGSRVI
jgi:serine protease Do